MIQEKLDKNSGAILFKKDPESRRLEDRISKNEKEIKKLRKEIKELRSLLEQNSK